MPSGGKRKGAGRKPAWNRDSIKIEVPNIIGYNVSRLTRNFDDFDIDDIDKIKLWESSQYQIIRKYNSPVSAGLGTTSSLGGDILNSDYEEINILEFLITNPGKMHLLPVTGDSMIDIGIFSGDLLIVEKTANIKDNDIIIVSLDDELMVKRLHLKGNKKLLVSENKEHNPIDISDREYEIQGVVRKSIRCNL
jgi:DNA polymerase V